MVVLDLNSFFLCDKHSLNFQVSLRLEYRAVQTTFIQCDMLMSTNTWPKRYVSFLKAGQHSWVHFDISVFKLLRKICIFCHIKWGIFAMITYKKLRLLTVFWHLTRLSSNLLYILWNFKVTQLSSILYL